MPSAALSFAVSLVAFSADISTDAVRSQISTGSCPTQPAGGGSVRARAGVWRHLGAVVVENHATVLVVPWSVEATNSANCPPSVRRMQVSMMDYMATEIFDIDSMPRGGPDASWLDRRLQTDRLEYLDRDDVDDL